MNDEDLTYCDRYDFKILQNDLKKHFGTRLSQFRERSGLSQETLAADIGVERNTISRMELGLVWPKYQNLIAAATRLGASPADFFDFNEVPQISKPTPELATAMNEEREKLVLIGEIVSKLSSLDKGQLRGIKNLVLGHASVSSGLSQSATDDLRDKKRSPK